MVRRAALVVAALLGACEDPDTEPPGDWDVTMACDDGVAADALPSCAGGAGGILRLEEASEGEHRTFFPGFPRDDEGYTGMPGPASWGFTDGELVVSLVGDLDDPFASEAEREAWRAHTLVFTGRFESVCWSGRFAWVDDAGAVEVEGDVQVLRAGLSCR